LATIAHPSTATAQIRPLLIPEHGIPDFYFVHAGTKSRFLTETGHQKSGSYHPDQPSATSPHFGQTCLFTNFPNILTTIRGSEFKGIREKAGLSKMGPSCRRLAEPDEKVQK
jgi:hypothetical protein